MPTVCQEHEAPVIEGAVTYTSCPYHSLPLPISRYPASPYVIALINNEEFGRGFTKKEAFISVKLAIDRIKEKIGLIQW